jgi:FixJ family two-component response regulator
VREALSELLEVTGYASRCFKRGDALLAEPAVDNFDCIVTDVRMPGIDGIELLEQLRGRGFRMPVIFITSTDDPATRRRALQSGAHAYLAKPAADEMLLAHLRSALEGEGASSVR